MTNPTQLIEQLVEDFAAARETLQRVNDQQGYSPICDTIWHTPHETLFDFMDAALTAARAHLEQPTEPDCVGGSPCTTCADKQACATGCVRMGEFVCSPAPGLTEIEDPVTVPRGLLGAACSAIARKDDAPKTLEQLRQYTFCKHSTSMTGKTARSLDKAWALFCSEIGEVKSPYPGMIGAFEAHYGQSFKDKDWRNEASVWAQAWSAATRATTPPSNPASTQHGGGAGLMSCQQHDLMKLVTMPSGGGPGIETVIRWCRVCGCVVGDVDVDGRTAPGSYFKMLFPKGSHAN